MQPPVPDSQEFFERLALLAECQDDLELPDSTGMEPSTSDRLAFNMVKPRISCASYEQESESGNLLEQDTEILVLMSLLSNQKSPNQKHATNTTTVAFEKTKHELAPPARYIRATREAGPE